MTSSPDQITTTSDSYGSLYYKQHLGCDQEYSWSSDHWRTFFTGIADRIVALTNPANVLDVGCARGLLVQALGQHGVDARGIDISAHAIETSDPSVRDRLAVQTADQVTGRWDLITCIEVVEHMSPADAELALDAMCAATDRILISSSPGDFTEPTHVNVREPAAWAASFAERGFYRRTDVDLAFLTPWAVLFERANLSSRDVVHRYERWAYPMRVEVLEKRAALLAAHQALQEQAGSSVGDELEAMKRELEDVRSQLREAQHQALTTRDYAMGIEAETGRLRRDLQRAIDERDQALNNLHREAIELSAVRSSLSWKVGNRLVRPLSRARRIVNGK